MNKADATYWAHSIASKGVSRGTSEVNASVTVGRFLAAELQRAGYDAEHETLYRGRQRITYERRPEVSPCLPDLRK